MIFKNIFKTTNEYAGALLDARNNAEKLTDYQVDEVALGETIKYIDNIDKFPFYEIRDQKRGNTCVAQAYAKARGILVAQKTGQYLPLSSAYIYKRRSNAPNAGMAMHDVLNIGAKEGTPPETMFAFQGAADGEIAKTTEHAALDDYAKVVSGKDQYVYIQNRFEKIAEQAQNRPVIVFIYATSKEWGRVVPEIMEDVNLSTAPIRHAVCVLAPVIFEHQPYLLVDESWGVSNSAVENDLQEDLRNRGQRLLSIDWVNNRVYSAATFIPKFSFETNNTVNVRHYFGIDMEFGNDNVEVKALQLVLQELGYFPKEVTCTGKFFGVTLKAVKEFQIAYDITTINGAGYGRVGPKTRAKLNELIGV
jgi:hypothetical protein